MPNFEEVFKRRSYRHFDDPISLRRAKSIAQTPTAVERHGFYPFIKRIMKTPRYVKERRCNDFKPRPIMYAAHVDAAIYSWYGAILSEAYEGRLQGGGLQKTSIAYRKLTPPKFNIHFARDAFQFIEGHRPCIALAFDIEKFFDAIDHRLLLSAWRDILQVSRLPADHFQVYRSLTKHAFVEEKTLYRTLKIEFKRRSRVRKRLCLPETFRDTIRKSELVQQNEEAAGIPQGSPMSAVLSNIFMLSFDKRLKEFADSCGGFAQRYSDDILIIVPCGWKEKAETLVGQALEVRKLKRHDGKTDCVYFPCPKDGLRVDPPIQYLGLTFDGERTLIRSKTLSRYHARTRAYIRRAAKAAAANVSHPEIYQSTLNRRFTHRGGRNFISYARRCEKGTASASIRKQIAKHPMRIRKWADELTNRYRSKP